HADDGVGPHDASVLDHAVHGMATAVLEQFGVLGDLAALDGLEGGAEALERPHAADDQTEAAPDVAVGLPLGEVEGGGDGQRGVGGGCPGGASLVLRLAHVRPPRGRVAASRCIGPPYRGLYTPRSYAGSMSLSI